MEIRKNAMIMVKGDSESITVTCRDASGMGKPFITGDKVYFTVKRSLNETTIILQKVVDTFTDGVASILIYPNETKGMDAGTYVYDIQITFADGTVNTVVKPNMFILEGEVTYE